MVRTCVILLAIILVEARQPNFKIFEIRKTRDHEHRLDDQYYDPDFGRFDSVIHREKDKKIFLQFADDIVRHLQRLSERKQARKSSESSENEKEFVDETRSVVVIPRERLAHHLKTDKNILEKIIQSALRTHVQDIEDRTAPPRHRSPYEYDYD